MLAQEADSLQAIILDRVPGENQSNVEYEKLLREQSIGEIRGLRKLAYVAQLELEELLEEAKKENITL